MFIISTIMNWNFKQRFGFLAGEVARLYGQQFDRLARERIGLSQAQCRLLGVLAAHEGDEPLSQTEMAQRLGLSTMAVAGLCDRMTAAGWIRREASPTDRRINRLRLEPRARKALTGALAIGDDLTARALATLSASERAQLLSLLTKARDSLAALANQTEEVE
jgi:DNA-binding MarR family transcriptional regulator